MFLASYYLFDLVFEAALLICVLLFTVHYSKVMSYCDIFSREDLCKWVNNKEYIWPFFLFLRFCFQFFTEQLLTKEQVLYGYMNSWTISVRFSLIFHRSCLQVDQTDCSKSLFHILNNFCTNSHYSFKKQDLVFMYTCSKEWQNVFIIWRT